MGNFFAFIHAPQTPPNIFARGLAEMQARKRGTRNSSLANDWASVATFTRMNESGAPLVMDAAGNWLIAVGTWFRTSKQQHSGAENDLLEACVQHGAAHLARELSGFFVIVYGHAATREVFVITDIIGSRHAFLRQLPEGVALGSSSLVLAALAPVQLDALGCEEFIRTGVIYEDRTFYQEVRKLAPASVYRFGNGQFIEKQTYWRIADLTPNALAGQHAVEAFSASIIEAARQVSRCAPRLLCDLTGGYDSRALVAAFLSADADFATTVTGAPQRPDVYIAQGLAAITGKPHFPVDLAAERRTPVTYAEVQAALALTDGEYDIVEYGLGVLPVHARTATQYDLSANGSFGEVARGYWWELLLPQTGARQPLDARKVAAGRYVVDPNSATLFDHVATARLIDHFAGVIRRANEGLEAAPNTLQMDHAYLRLRMQRWQGRIASATDQIRPCLSPFLLRAPLETMLQATPQIRQRSLLVRAMLKQLQPQLAAYPLEHGYPAEPFGATNFYRFAPLLTSYGSKVWQKGLRVLGVRDAQAAANGQAQEPPRVQLWRDEAVQQLLQPERMGVARLFDAASLTNFLTASRQATFAYEQQWCRIVSLESAWQSLSAQVK